MSSKAKRVVYIGKQADFGTGVNVDVALRAMSSYKMMTEKIKVEENIGSYAPARHYIGSVKSGGELSLPAAYYDHAPYLVSMALGDGATVFNDPDTTWTFAIPDATVDTIAVYSLEYGDGANHIVRGVDVFATGLEISGEAGKAWVIKVPAVGGATTKPAAHTATPSPTAAPRTIKMADTTLSIDDAWAGLGTTPLPKLISFTWKLENLFHQKLFAGSLSPNDYGNDVWAISLEVTVEAEHAVTEAEMDKMLTEDLSVVQIYANDSVAASTYEFQINGVYFIEDVSELDDRDGNNIIKLKYSGQNGSGNTGNLIINSALAAL